MTWEKLLNNMQLRADFYHSTATSPNPLMSVQTRYNFAAAARRMEDARATLIRWAGTRDLVTDYDSEAA